MFLRSSISLNEKEVVALIGCFQSSVLNTFGEFYYSYLFKSREVGVGGGMWILSCHFTLTHRLVFCEVRPNQMKMLS